MMMENKNLIRFDWAIKRLLRNKANFTVLEGFLSELFRRDIKVLKILESESNQDAADDKFNRVDILVEDVGNELIIIEVQSQNEFDYFQRMLYGTSKVVVENIDLGTMYAKVKKVYSVNIVYFDLGQGEDYVYWGATDFKGVHKQDSLKLSRKQISEFNKMNPFELFPEYYVIKVNQFNDVATDTLDEWIYYLKNNDIPDGFKAKGLAQAKELLKVDLLSKSEKEAYFKHLEDLRYKASMVYTWKIEEEDKIRRERDVSLALKSIELGLSTTVVAQITRLSEDEVNRLKTT